MQIPDSLASFWNTAGPYITHGIAIILSAFAGFTLKTIHFRRKLNLRNLDEFYGPMLGLIEKVTANTKNTFEFLDASNQAWQEECEKHPHPFEDHDKYFQPFQKALDDENKRLHEEVTQALDEMVILFKSKWHLVYPSTKSLYPHFLQYVDNLHRTLPYKVWNKLDPSAKILAELHADIEAHVDNLNRKLSGDKHANDANS